MMTKTVMSWGGYPICPQSIEPVSWRSDVPDVLRKMVDNHLTTLPFGNGRSYGDSCLAQSGTIISMRALDRFISADWHSGVVTVEAGMTLGELSAVAIPRGWALQVTPGTKYATIGGAIANDVHGKNHHVRGTFGNHVLEFMLVRSDHGLLRCSLHKNHDYFAATVGGLGLTGAITWATLQLMPIQSNMIEYTTERFGNLDGFFSLSKELDTKHEFSVAWVDCLASGTGLGRGVYMAGDYSKYGELKSKPSRSLTFPFTAPVSLINTSSIKIFNEVYWRKAPASRTFFKTSSESFFYPLDNIDHWNRIYGNKGFQQFQCVIPHEVAEDAIKELLTDIARSGEGSFLAVLKRCGGARSPGLISFPLDGTSLALDFANTRQVKESLLKRLDRIVSLANGRLYPAKDAHMNGIDFRTAYPKWLQVEKLRDPTLNSQFWKRVTQ